MSRQVKTKAKTPVAIRFKQLKNGSQSIYLDIYYNGKRSYEFLKLYINPGKDPLTKLANENAMAAARMMQAQKMQMLTATKSGIQSETKESKMTTVEYANMIIEEKQRAGMAISNMLNLRKWLVRYERKPTRIQDIDKRWVANFYAWVNRQRIKDEQTMKPSTLNNIYVLLSYMLNHAVMRDYIPSNPAKSVTTDKVRKVVPERAYLTEQEMKAMENAECPSEELKKEFLFSCYTGLRHSDIETLRWTDVHEHEGLAYIAKKIVKTKNDVTIPISNRAISLMGERGDGLVFKHINRTSLRRWMAVWVANAGITKHITFHSARHTFATLLLTKGVDIYTVSELLVHSDIKTTQIYAKIVDSKKWEAVDLLD